MRPLSDTRIRILKRLASRDLERDGAETAREIALACKASDANAVLSNLALAGLAVRLGVTMSNARTWTITPSGRSALAEAEKAE